MLYQDQIITTTLHKMEIIENIMIYEKKKVN